MDLADCRGELYSWFYSALWWYNLERHLWSPAGGCVHGQISRPSRHWKPLCVLILHYPLVYSVALIRAFSFSLLPKSAPRRTGPARGCGHRKLWACPFPMGPVCPEPRRTSGREKTGGQGSNGKPPLGESFSCTLGFTVCVVCVSVGVCVCDEDM